MIISTIEDIENDFINLLTNLETLKTELIHTDWNSSYLQVAENRIDEIKTIIIDQQRSLNDFTEELIKNDTNESLDDDYIDDDYEPEIYLDDIMEDEERDIFDDEN